ncbi:PKD domain-containing protein [Methanoregula sp.]|uniref:PKD domain-containing protein n=1 Tax=Methanoregula sp. TaxID=2052170 RepID=UPI0023693429|nr:PKD domain-containing protein [Methanoregula sp.]MDD1686876.1 PKD domain-containing protein [Methanoregula sp.]
MKRLAQIFLLLIATGILLLPVPVGAGTGNETGPGYITVTNPPVADFFTSIRYGHAPFTVSFADTSRGYAPMSYQWDFGDGSGSAEQNPTHTYRNDGEYTVSLTVTNQYGSNTKTVPAYIGAGSPPVADFTATPRDGTIPLTVSFTDSSTNKPDTWLWDFGDGATSAEQNPSHTYTQAGIYPVRLSVSNHFGSNALSQTAYINASSPVPVAVTVPAEPVKEKPGGIIGLIQEAKGTTEKNLPTAAFIPPQFMALAAVLTSMGVVVIQILLANIGTLSQIGLKAAKFLADLAGGHAVEKLSEKEIEARNIAARKMERHFFGLSPGEVIIVEAAVLMVAIAYILADRAELTLQVVLIYIAVGAVSVVLHDFGHRYFATKHGCDADIRFWGLGTIIMFLTAWLYGSAFAQPYRNLVNRDAKSEQAETREIGIEMVAGPVVSIILMIIFLGMVQLGGLWAIAGGIGFVINLITAVYSLIPISTMDGGAIWRWNRSVYLALFIPMIVFYFFTFMLV